jgi:hypothetical protein
MLFFLVNYLYFHIMNIHMVQTFDKSNDVKEFSLSQNLQF